MSATTSAAGQLDRFLGFAFAAADLLVEATPEGEITFVTGAVQLRLGVSPAALLGQRVTALVTLEDRAPLAIALATAGLRGRITPMVLRLNDAERSPVTVGAILVAGPPARLCLAFGQVPIAAPAVPTPSPGALDARSFTREVEASLRAGQSGAVTLIEVKDWSAMCEALSPPERRRMREGIDAALGAGTQGAIAGEIAAGRFGVLSGSGADVAAISRLIERAVRATRLVRPPRVDGTVMALTPEAMAPSQAARALRWVLSQFATAGIAGATAAGSGGGLEKVMSIAEARARTMSAAIADRRFRLSFQPVVGLGDRRVHHYESLLRPLPAADGTVLGTQDFVTFVEAVGLSEELDLAVAEQALATLRAAPAVSIAVNVSGLSMQSADFCDRLLALLRGAPGITAAQRLLVELTETAEIDDMPQAAASIHMLRAAGVPVCLDDFGAGAAAFHYLRDFTVDFVKIDGAYVQRAARETRERQLVGSMVEMALATGAQVVAEMIETDEQAAMMRQLGVQFGQGWLFGRPGLLPGLGRSDATRLATA